MQKMISKMAPKFPILIWMGFMIVALAFVIGYFNSQTAAAYFSESKVVRESTLLAERAPLRAPTSGFLISSSWDSEWFWVAS